MESMADTTAAFRAVPSALERYGACWEDKPLPRTRISA
jgi:hypothetical protein